MPKLLNNRVIQVILAVIVVWLLLVFTNARALFAPIFEFMGVNRELIAATVIAAMAIAFVASIIIGVRETRRRRNEDIFGDPQRTLNGWYWAVTGVSAVRLISTRNG